MCDGAQMAIFGDFFASCVFSEPRAAGFRPGTMCGSMADIESAAAEIRRGKKEEEEDEQKQQHKNIMVCPIT